MRLREYATPDEFLKSDYCEDPDAAPDDIAKLIRRASGTVESLTLTARYVIDDDGMPADDEVIEAFREAVCAQVAYFLETGDVSGAAAGSPAVSIGSLSLGGKAISGGEQRASRYSPEAVEILSTAGLMPASVGR